MSAMCLWRGNESCAYAGGEKGVCVCVCVCVCASQVRRSMGFGWMRSDNATERENSLGSEKEDGIHGWRDDGDMGAWLVG